MSNVDIYTLWITRKSIDAGFHFPEMVAAWDEYGIDENYEGWKADCDKALDAVGSELAEKRVIRLRVNTDLIEAAFEAPAIDAQVGR